MRDLLPADMRAFRRVEDAFRAAAGHWGYEEIRTPTIETYSLFTAAGALTPQMLSRVYSFLDWDGWSGERVVLRPDSTIPVARAVAQANLPLPARLAYVQNVFRFSESGDREDWQYGIEYLGAPELLGELEVAALALETLDALGLEAGVRLSHAGITSAIIRAAGANGNAASVADAIAEAGLAAIRPYLAGAAAVAPFVEAALHEGRPEMLANLSALAAPVLPEAKAALEELSAVAAALGSAGRNVIIDLGMPRAFGYYTGAVFELSTGGETWGSGGRYTPYGHPAGSACGLGLEASRLAAHLTPSTTSRPAVAIVPNAASDTGRAILVARSLHRAGIVATLVAETGSATVGVTVDGDRLAVRTPGGEQQAASLDELAGLLIQFK